MKRFLCFILATAMVFLLAACGGGGAGKNMLTARALNTVKYSAKDRFDIPADSSFLSKLSAFSGKIYEMAAEEEDGNYVISPISIYMALAILNRIGDDGVKADVERLFGMSQQDIAKTGELFENLIFQRDYPGGFSARLDLTNSIWTDSSKTANESVLDELARLLYCHAYSAPFEADNRAANKAIRDFIKDQTRGLIDEDFDLDRETLVAIINTLYLKDIWNAEKLPVSSRTFYSGDKKVSAKFLTAPYSVGRVQETNSSYFYHTRTEAGYYVKFILPKDGFSLKDVMTADNLTEINSYSFNLVEANPSDFTRCIFPCFEIASDTELDEILEKNGYLRNAFTAFNSDLIDDELCVSDIIHKAVLKTDETGIEGAAVTIIAVKATSMDPSDITYHDFVLDRDFGFLVTDPHGVVLFEGQVTDPVLASR